jgi:hypothetical protein
MNPRKQHLTLTSVVVAALAFAAIAITASAAAPLKITNCTTASSRPKTLTLACADANTVLKSLSWSSFGGATAVAKGTLVVNSCEPNCAAGKALNFAVNVKATTAKRCKGTLRVYEKLTITYRTTSKPGLGVPTKYKLGCPG